MQHLRYRILSAAVGIGLLTGATVLAATPAGAASTLTCPAPAGTAPSAEALTRPTVSVATPLVRPDGNKATAYSDVTVPQAVVNDPATGHAFVAYLMPGDGAGAHPKAVVAEVDRSGKVLTASTLLDASGGASLDFGAFPLDDSGNAFTIAIDKAGYVHVAGNTRSYRPMGYWRSAKPHSAAAMLYKSQLPNLVYNAGGVSLFAASAERVASSPMLFTTENGDLYFGFNHYETGKGNFYLLRYDASAQRWTNPSGGVDTSYGFTDTNAPLLAGYADDVSPAVKPIVAGPDGWYWLSWSWRDDAGTNSNSRISVAKTKDFSTWYTAYGKKLPATVPYSLVDTDPSYSGLVVADLTRTGSGNLPGQFSLGFAGDGTPVVTYSAYTGTGAGKRTNLFIARSSYLDKWSYATPLTMSGLFDVTQAGSGIPLTIDGAPRAVSGSTDLLIDYTCGGRSLTARVGIGPMGTYSTPVSTDYRRTSSLPLAAEQPAPTSVGFSVVPRTATSPVFTDSDGVKRQWILKWDAGSYIVDGSKPTGTYSPYGTVMSLYLVQP